MGGGHSKTITKTTHPHQDNIEKLYEDLCDYGILSKERFMHHFGCVNERVATNLFDRFFIDLLNSSSITKTVFVERVQQITDVAYNSVSEQLRFYVDLIAPNDQELTRTDIRDIFTACANYGIIQTPSIQPDKDEINTHNNNSLIDGLIQSCMNDVNVTNRDAFVEWTSLNFPSLFAGLQVWLYFKFTGVKMKTGNFEMLLRPSECDNQVMLLEDVLLWFLCTVLPSCFTHLENKYKMRDDDVPDDKEVEYTWNLLYDSNQHGLSLNRFKHKVMGYKSPTVTLLKFESGLTLVLAIDQAWTDSPEQFGGPYTQLWEISPKTHLVEGDSKMIYLKENGRSVPTGLLIGTNHTRPKIKITTDLSTAEVTYKGNHEEHIQKIEVWGCGGVEAVRSQADMKKWESKEVEKRRKVKLPGQWDTDKTILEMGGVCVNHSQRGDF